MEEKKIWLCCIHEPAPHEECDYSVQQTWTGKNLNNKVDQEERNKRC